MDGGRVHGSDSVALLFTDIEGSTTLWVDHPDDAGRAVTLHDEIISSAIDAHGGTVIKTTGDGFLASFGSVRAAVETAIDAQRSLRAQSGELLDAAHVRMGIHAGRVEARHGDLFGLAVNKCQRIMAAGRGGQVLASTAASAMVRDDLPPGTELIDLGDQQLRGIPGVERVFQVAHPELRREFPPLMTAAAIPTNLPAELTSFVGRSREVEDVTALIAEHRLVTLTGVGGAGKTRLALHIAAEVTDLHPGGVWFIELDSLRDPDLVEEQFATTLNLEDRPGRTYVDVLVENLRGTHPLLVVDNCEHLLDACARVLAQLLRSLPDVSVLATSRQRIGVPSEVTYRVPSMAVPPAGSGLDDLIDADAVRLFIERAVLSHPSFEVTERNADDVARIVRQLDGIPLAIELAAANVDVMAPAQIADHLDDRFQLLTSGAREPRERHQTLGAAIDWSYELLTDAERTLLGQLSVFRGGFDLDAADGVCRIADVHSVIPILTGLVDKSLVSADVESGRYRLLETIRQFAEERLVERNHGGETSASHARYFTAFARDAGDGLDGPDQADWLATLEVERDNLRAALEWSLENEGTALEISAAIWRFWLLRRRPQEGRDWLSRSLDARRVDDDPMRVQALVGSGMLASNQGDREAARIYLQHARELAAALGDQRSEALALASLATLDHKEGRLEDAVDLLQDALAGSRAADDRPLSSRILANLALILDDLGRETEASHTADEALRMSRKTNVPDLIADALLTSGELALNHGDDRRAGLMLEEAYRTSTDAGFDYISAWAQSYLGKLRFRTGELQASRALLGEAVEMFSSMDSPMGCEWALRHLALAELASGEIPTACDSARSALRLAAEYVRPDLPHALAVAGEVMMATGARDEARLVLTACRHIGEEMGLGLSSLDRHHREELLSILGTDSGDERLDEDGAIETAERVLSAGASVP